MGEAISCTSDDIRVIRAIFRYYGSYNNRLRARTVNPLMYYWLIVLFHLVVMPIAALHVLVSKRDHRAALGWIGVIVIFPVAGPVIYFVFGINRVRTKARLFAGRHLPVMHFGYERATREPGDDHDPMASHVDPPYLAEIGARATGRRLSANNQITPFINGEQFFPRLIQVIDEAKEYILLSSYLFSPSGVGGEVINALSRAAARGVTVRVLIDGIGAWYSLQGAIQPLRRAGVKVRLFRPPGLLPPSLDINLRNHRKIVVVDHQIGFFGGINIDQRHMVNDPNNRHITEDVHFEARGPVVHDLHRSFADDWLLITRTPLDSPLDPAEPAGTSYCRVIDDGPGDNLSHLSMTLSTVFTAAREHITILMPYFLPNQEMTAALQSASLRGVKVQVVLPERSNLRFVDWATRNMLWELLLWDVEVYYKPAPFAHTKLVVVDDHYVLGGSANLDARSLRLNYELGVEVFDAPLAEYLHQHIQAAIDVSTRVTLERLDQRPFWQRVRDAFFWLFSSYL
ncbi:phospholipase D-like domain-containing protein [Marinimicrobium sp. ABcell2]|uniref:phospholipase D-like domain-containing protein n=1 Tax=Marinimicrobium sp. ABcell2 TaxID=3069751 RepID=UPI0027B5F70A|nr:phospholipase D-like domain-containing protein [Marinimicrobium sp. ABcell2]MDQ2076333.1 phospholipase D-like domain-containing protein [Marinimicrobium sp. ABcell2]